MTSLMNECITTLSISLTIIIWRFDLRSDSMLRIAYYLRITKAIKQCKKGTFPQNLGNSETFIVRLLESSKKFTVYYVLKNIE